MKKAALAALACAAYLASLAIRAPADAAAWLAGRLSGGTVALAGARGGLWRGGAELLLGSPRRHVCAVEWRLRPLRLLSGRVSLSLKGAGPDARLSAELEASPRELRIPHLNAELPASALDGLYPGAEFGGALKLTASSIRIADMRRGRSAWGKLEGEWLQAATGLSAVRPLGDYRLSARGSGPTAEFTLETERGELLLDGDGLWQGGKFSARVLAQARTRQSELEPALRFLGKPDGQGRWVWQRK